MNQFFSTIEGVIGNISDTIWPFFLPFMLLLGAYLSIKFILQVQPQVTERNRFKFRNVIGPASISLGAMIGTGAIIGVLGSISKLYEKGQVHVESIALWAVIGSFIMVPVSYCETVISKVLKMTPKQYIHKYLGAGCSFVYCISFAILYILGVGGFQFSGIDSVVTIITDRFTGFDLSQGQRYCFIVIPVLLLLGIIVLTKKHSVFIHSMTYMIFTAVFLYFIFFLIFIVKTRSYVPCFFAGMWEGFTHPVNMMLGVPAGFILGMQRVLQTAEPGIGTMAMAAVEADSKPREAGQIALLPTIATIFVAIVVTSYIASYGIQSGFFQIPNDGIGRLSGFFLTVEQETGTLGLIILCLFTVLSALTTLLGSFFYLGQLFDRHENRNIVVYFFTIFLAGTLAVFGFNIIFDLVDLLLFVAAALNMTALAIFVTGKWKDYRR